MYCCGPSVTHIHLPTSESEDTFKPFASTTKTNHNVAKLQLYNKSNYDHYIWLKKYGIKNYKISRLVNLLLAFTIIAVIFFTFFVFFFGVELGIYCLYHNYFIEVNNNYALFGTCSLLFALIALTIAILVLKYYTKTFLICVHYVRYSKELYLIAPEYEKEFASSGYESHNEYSSYLST